MTAVDHGTLRLASTSGKQEVALEQRLLDLFLGLTEVIDRLKPDVLVVERVFFAKNAVSSLKLGQARGVVIVCGALKGLEIVEYSPTEVKRAVVGSGTADKVQVARVLEIILGRQEFATADSSDALALAICHGQQFLGGGAARVKSALAGMAKNARKSSKKGKGLAALLGLTPEVVGDRRRVDFSKKS
jgi:crossover junction endodeoxyribonuclease RuvC